MNIRGSIQPVMGTRYLLFAAVFCAILFSATAAVAIAPPYRPYIMTRWVSGWEYTAGEQLTVTMRIASNTADASNVLYMNYSELFATTPAEWNLSALVLTDPSGRVTLDVPGGSVGAVNFSVNLADGFVPPLEFTYTIPVPESMTSMIRLSAMNFTIGVSDDSQPIHYPVVTDLYPSGKLPEIDTSDVDALDNYINQLQQQGDEEGWTFEVDDNGVITRDSGALLGTALNYRPAKQSIKYFTLPKANLKALPDKFDWREKTPPVPVSDQGNCGSCWAFALVGIAERLVAAKDGVVVNFSEQWVLDCNPEEWSCNGGWNPYEMFSGPDACGKIGMVLESVLPYEEEKLTCGCDNPRTSPYNFKYEYTIPEDLSFEEKVAQIKQAIMTYGPVWTTVRAGTTPFLAYAGGVFNYKPSGGSIDHAVVLEGWDDTRGTNGVWILRNSWSELWGEDGYMLIEYDSSLVGSYPDVMSYAGSPNGNITVTIQPAAAVTAGAQWSLDGGTTWLNSGDTSPNVAPGDYTITYKDVTGFTAPADETVTLGERENLTRTGTYIAIDDEGEDEGETSEGELESMEDIAEFLLDQFSKYDTNGNGLRLDEAQEAIPYLTPTQFDMLDGDDDGFISRDELQEYLAGPEEPACCGSCSKSAPLGQRIKDYLADWLLVGLTILVLLSINNYTKSR